MVGRAGISDDFGWSILEVYGSLILGSFGINGMICEPAKTLFFAGDLRLAMILREEFEW